MKHLLFFLFLFSIYSLSAQDLSIIHSADRFENSKSCISKNNIASETIYNFTFQKKKSDSTIAKVITYNREGNIVERQSWNNNTLSQKETFIYSADNKIHQIVSENYPMKRYRISEYEYDSLGNETREYIFNRDTTDIVANEKTYNADNQILEYYTLLNNGTFKLEKTYSYNKNGILTKIELYDLYDPNKKVSSIYTYIVDANNNYKVAYYEDLNKKKQKTEFIYDNSNRCIKVKAFGIQPITYKDESTNSTIKTEFNVIPITEEYEYNADGTLFLMRENVDKKISRLRKHYYTRY